MHHIVLVVKEMINPTFRKVPNVSDSVHHLVLVMNEMINHTFRKIPNVRDSVHHMESGGCSRFYLSKSTKPSSSTLIIRMVNAIVVNYDHFTFIHKGYS